MQNVAAQQFETRQASLGDRPTQPQPSIHVRAIQQQAGEGTCCFKNDHTLWVSLSSRPIQLCHTQGGQTMMDLYGRGDMVITPANTRLFARWESDDHVLQIRLNTQFLDRIAQDTLETNSDRLELHPKFKVRDAQLEAIAFMLHTEHQQNQSSNQLYWDSLTNVLAVNLLQRHGVEQLSLPTYAGGLPRYQLSQVLDFIDAHLDEEVKLANLAQVTDMSPYHFSRLFKQSTGLSPHQYLLQQRIERAKQLLKQTNQSILDIAVACGFNSHSHLSRQFRQLTGVTPKAYRIH
ncbi:MAG: AraC family transcriptional regulator [Cyanobacteria bacterium J06626_14]